MIAALYPETIPNNYNLSVVPRALGVTGTGRRSLEDWAYRTLTTRVLTDRSVPDRTAAAGEQARTARILRDSLVRG